jgi:hypothetical protein
LALTSFGLTPQYKIETHRMMLTVAHYSKGAFSVLDLYQMPVYLRNFYIKEFGELKKKESAEMDKISNSRGKSK